MFQPNKINRLAEFVFKEEGQIKISGQGTLRKMFLSAYLSEDGRQILPPREHIYFNRNSHTGIDGALVHKVAIYFIISEEEAIEQVRLWENRVLERSEVDQLRFGKYGIFQFDNQLNFVSDSLYIYDWMPTVSYQSTGTPVHEISHRVSELASPQQNRQPKVRRKILIPALWAVLICFFAFAAFLWSEPLNMLLDNQMEMNTRLVNVAPESYSTPQGRDYFSDTHKLESMDSDPEEKSASANKETPVSSDVNKTGKPEIDKPSPNRKTDAKPSLKNKKNVESSVQIPAEISPRCTLIVGAFANPDNVERMVTRLYQYNVEVITMERQTLTLVGAQVRCGDHNQIDVLKNQIEPNAWIYKK